MDEFLVAASSLDRWQWAQLFLITISAALGMFGELRLITSEHNKALAGGGFTFASPITGVGAIIGGGFAAIMCGVLNSLLG